MDFTLDETTQAVQDLATEIVSKHAGREGAQGETDFEEGTWKALTDAGLLSLAVPERLGGAGLGPLAVAVALGAFGRRTARVPALSTALGVLPIARLGSTEQQDRLLADPGRVFAAALNEPSAPLPPAPRTSVQDGRITGTKIGVLHADHAHCLLVSVSTSDCPGVMLVDPAAEGLSWQRVSASSGDEWVLRLDDVSGEFLGEPGPATLAEVHACVTAGICALADGAVTGALELTAEHLRAREQFGKPLASFQAVAQQIAEVYVRSRTLHLATLSACWRLEEGLDATADLDVAAFWLAEQAPAAMHTCHHLHGGVGLDISYPMHRHYALVKDLARLLGGVGHRTDALAAGIG